MESMRNQRTESRARYVHGRLCDATGIPLSRVSLAPPRKTKTQIILYAVRHTAIEKRVARSPHLIGLFRPEGRRDSSVARSYLHTNSAMVIRDAPL